MSIRWVLNASPVICLARAGYEHLLVNPTGQALLPMAVAEEIQAGPPNDPARLLLETGIFLIIPTTEAPEVLAWDLGRGETAVLSYAYLNSGFTAIIDDLAARKCARSLQIAHKGTLAVIIMAKKQGLIPSAAEVLHKLLAVGLRLDEPLIRSALKETLN